MNRGVDENHPMTTIIIHLPTHRERALQIERESREARDAYDANIAAYIDFLRRGAERAGYLLQTDQRDDIAAAYSIEEADGTDKRAAHAWLESQPDIWNWMP